MISTAIGSQDALPMVTQRLDYRQHLLEGDEAATVTHLVMIDGLGQLGGVGRKALVRVAKLPTLTNAASFRDGRTATIDESNGRMRDGRL